MHRIALRTPALFPKPQVKNTLRIPIYQLDAFASAPFKGNPAAVCPLDACAAQVSRSAPRRLRSRPSTGQPTGQASAGFGRALLPDAARA